MSIQTSKYTMYSIKEKNSLLEVFEMTNYMCTEKIYDTKSRLIGYKIKDEHGREKSVDTGTLKNAIRTGKINIYNLELTSSNRLVYRTYTYILCEYSNKDKHEVMKETTLRPGTKVEIGNGTYNLVISTINENKVLDIYDIFDYYEERRRPGTWKKRFKKFERTRYHSEFEDIGINVYGYGTPYLCKLWIDKNIYIECLALYDGPVLYRIEEPSYLVYKGNK